MDETAWRKTACILCECNCGLEVQLGGESGRRLIRFRGDKAHPASKGYACEKPHRLDYYQNADDRLRTPMRRRPDGTYEAIDWDTAIAEVAQRLAAVRDTHGGETIFYYGGGGQGNHLCGAYATATRRALDSRWRSSALAQEKTGMFWVSDRMLGTFTRSDFEHCEVGLFIGKNPWQSHSIPRARVTIREIARDPARTLIVIDPVRTETAAMADIHLQVRPGMDAWLLAAMDAILLDEDLVDHAFIDAHATGFEAVRKVLAAIPIAEYCRRAGIAEAKVRAAVRRIASASSVSSMEDLGVQMNHHSTLVTYLHRLLWLLTGNFGKPGTQYVPTPLLNIAGGASRRTSPVVGAKIVGGMVPCNVIAEEILTEHPKRYRAMIVEAANPAHSLADSKKFRAAMRALDVSVVIDVAMTETAREADYVLPASTQFEKAEATFFNFEFPDNYFQLRPALLEPAEGTLPEAEIHARLCEALGVVTEAELGGLHEAAREGPEAYAMRFFTEVMGDAKRSGLAAVYAYRTLGPTLPEGLAEGAVVWGLALRCAMQYSASLARAGFEGPPPVQAGKLFRTLLEQPSGVVFAVDEWSVVRSRVATSDGKIHLALDDLLAEIGELNRADDDNAAQWPFVLAAGERRSFTANTIIRDPQWRKKDLHGALRVSVEDGAALGLVSGDRARLTTSRGSAEVVVEISDRMQPGHISLPNGTGMGAGDRSVAPNELTALEDRDRFVGTPWHKHVRARLERV